MSNLVNEMFLRDVIIDYISEHFCEGCSQLRYELGQWECPYGDDPECSECHRSGDWAEVNSQLDEFLENIRANWPASA